MQGFEYYRDLLLELTKKEIKVRYKSSYFGYVWSIANPLFLALIFNFVFKVVTKIEMPNYTLFLISGLFVWQWISNSIMLGTNIYVSNSSLIKKVAFPRNFLVIASVLSEGFNFLVSIPIIIVFMLYYDQTPLLNWLLIVPLLLLVSSLFIYALTLLIATINLFFRDMERLVGLLLTFLFYLTPIIYPLSMVPDNYRYLLYLNPFSPLVLTWQQLFLHNRLDMTYFTISLLYSLILFMLSTWVFNRFKSKFAELV